MEDFSMVKTAVDGREPDDEFPLPKVNDYLFERGKLSIVDQKRCRKGARR
jgi:hypothetical protein